MLAAIMELFFAGTALSSLPTATADPRPVALSKVVPKTLFSDKVRFIFLAGLEGTGHHYVLAAGGAVAKKTHLNKKPFYLPSAMGGSASDFAENERLGRLEMKELAREAAGLANPAIYFPSNPWSFPANPGPAKVLQYDDLRRMTEAADLEGLDVRVVYLKRSAQDIIIADTVHRHFQE